MPEYIQRPSSLPLATGQSSHVVSVVLDGIEFATASGETLKTARHKAAEETLAMLSKDYVLPGYNLGPSATVTATDLAAVTNTDGGSACAAGAAPGSRLGPGFAATASSGSVTGGGSTRQENGGDGLRITLLKRPHAADEDQRKTPSPTKAMGAPGQTTSWVTGAFSHGGGYSSSSGGRSSDTDDCASPRASPSSAHKSKSSRVSASQQAGGQGKSHGSFGGPFWPGATGHKNKHPVEEMVTNANQKTPTTILYVAVMLP